MKAIARQCLLALDYLHDICGIFIAVSLFDQLQVSLTNLHDADVKPRNIFLQRTVDSLSSIPASLSTTDALNSAGQPTSQALPVTRLPTDGLRVKIAAFGQGGLPCI